VRVAGKRRGLKLAHARYSIAAGETRRVRIDRGQTPASPWRSRRH